MPTERAASASQGPAVPFALPAKFPLKDPKAGKGSEAPQELEDTGANHPLCSLVVRL